MMGLHGLKVWHECGAEVGECDDGSTSLVN